MLNIMRRKRTRLPTWMSIGFGCFLLAIYFERFLVSKPQILIASWPSLRPQPTARVMSSRGNSVS
jgi:hypothetical protein